MPKKTKIPTEADFLAVLGLAVESAEKRRGPRTTWAPEDCGGVPGYFQLLEAFRVPTAENEELREWAGGEFDPEVFSADAVNQCWTGRRKRTTT
jgi:hypothetical protein